MGKGINFFEENEEYKALKKKLQDIDRHDLVNEVISVVDEAQMFAINNFFKESKG